MSYIENPYHAPSNLTGFLEGRESSPKEQTALCDRRSSLACQTACGQHGFRFICLGKQEGG